jgi:Zn-dependent M28 family amino/carboxypeptidase
MINLDMIGVGRTLGIYSATYPDPMADRALELAKALGIAGTRGLDNQSDHVSFAEAGIPAVFFNRPENDDIHTEKDTIEKIVPAYVAEVVRLTLALVKSFI